jgi:hypothetical protein
MQAAKGTVQYVLYALRSSSPRPHRTSSQQGQGRQNKRLTWKRQEQFDARNVMQAPDMEAPRAVRREKRHDTPAPSTCAARSSRRATPGPPTQQEVKERPRL